jgi:hypothetical protein
MPELVFDVPHLSGPVDDRALVCSYTAGLLVATPAERGQVINLPIGATVGVALVMAVQVLSYAMTGSQQHWLPAPCPAPRRAGARMACS